MALRSGPALLKAIEGFRGETSGSKQHEEMNSILSRVVDEIHKGSAPAQDSPGRRSAREAAGQREMPAEHGHSGGSGATVSNEPGHAGAPQPPRDIAGGDGRNDKLSNVVPPSRGNRVSNATASFPPREAAIKRIIATNESSRAAENMPSTADKNKPGGQNESVAKAPPAPREGRIGDVSAPEGGGGSLASTERAAASSDKQPEAKPPYAQESIADRRARAKKAMS